MTDRPTNTLSMDELEAIAGRIERAEPDIAFRGKLMASIRQNKADRKSTGVLIFVSFVILMTLIAYNTLELGLFDRKPTEGSQKSNTSISSSEPESGLSSYTSTNY